MTTPTLELIHHHGSARQYKDDPIAPDVIETIVAAAQRSSTSSNLQLYSVVAVTDAAKRARLAELCGQQAHIAQAPVFLVWCADLSRLDRVCQRRGYRQVVEYVENWLVAVLDVAIASQTAALAAESLGLGICYIGGVRGQPQEMIDLLGLPRLVFPVVGMTVGWPAVTPAVRPRLATSAVLHWEAYDLSGEDQALRDYDQVMMQTGIYTGRQLPAPGAAEEIAEYGWQEHSARRVSQPFRTSLRQALSAQGFDLK